MSPARLESILFLYSNQDSWDITTVNDIVKSMYPFLCGSRRFSAESEYRDDVVPHPTYDGMMMLEGQTNTENYSFFEFGIYNRIQL
jgi:hypothetical protein